MRTPTVLFDLGDVLVRLDFARGFEHFRRLATDRVPADLASAQVFFGAAALGCNQGLVSPADFLTAIAAQLELPPAFPQRALADAWCDIFVPWPEMEALAAEVLEAGHAAYLASNTDPLHFAYLQPRMPILGRLSGCYLSYEAKLLKPDPEFFRVLLGQHHLAASECVYLDDRPEHVASARSVGIRAEVHTGDVTRARAFLRESGVQLP